MIKELAIAARDFRHARRGDVIACRDPLPYIGTREGSDWLWLKVETTYDIASRLQDSTPWLKRRYAIPFEKLRHEFPSFDERKILPGARYQPFKSQTWIPNLQSLVVDKGEMRLTRFEPSGGFNPYPIIAVAALMPEEARERLRISRRRWAQLIGLGMGAALIFRAQELQAATARRTGTSESISTFGDGTRNYTSMATWESATDNDNVTGTVSPVLECYDDSASFNVTVDMAGSTNNATYFRIIRPASGQGHNGTSNTGFFVSSTSAAHTLVVTEQYSSLQDLIVKAVYSSASNLNVVSLEGANTRAIGMIVFDSSNSGAGISRGFSGGGVPKYYILCLANNTEDTGFVLSGTSYVYNCTAVACGNPTGGAGFNNGGTCVVKNCLSSDNGNGNDDFTNSGTSTGSQYNASKDATGDDLGATGSRVSQTFTFVSAAGDDFHLSDSDAGAKGFGTSLAADANFAFDDDIDKQTITTWSMGFDSKTTATPIFKRYYDLLRS